MLSSTSLLALSLSALVHLSSAGVTEVINGVTVSNCPGAMVVQGTTATYCCVGGTGFSMSFCDGFPFCSSTDTVTTTSATSLATPTCQTTIPLSATNFQQLVESASRSLASASGSASASASAAATPSTGSTASSTGTGTGTGTGTSTGSQAQQTQNAAVQGIKVSFAALVGAMVFLAGGLS
ncbi:hypothetical protein PV10_01396 [Exophiala mesophila]|uniref:Extracellular membrane protein CFEM domain-containing protein n=1 Tax=Exophiala mesophila TaxID=212818 RepID=A0A0D1X757_EXOME|nr:uncharacterized protein PV10_01396 [Exophiala mesophila]KIV97680.1 hypothetical protein PV10_01396 [Exophiala mesophila]